MGVPLPIRGILFDAGGVLTGPVGGRWNPRYDFEGIVLAHHPGLRAEAFGPAIAAGQRFLDAGSTTAGRADYHRVMLRELGIAEPGTGLLHELEAPAAGPVIELYPDVRPALEWLHEAGIAMAIVSDNWAGFEVLLRRLGIEHFFAGIVLSEVLGCRKPDPRMYEAGRAAVGLEPGACLFIDDDPELVAAAVALGYQGVTMAREPVVAGLPAITTLAELPALVAPR
jgi:HAD superfamily hydrolase (TIGR01509 family)